MKCRKYGERNTFSKAYIVRGFRACPDEFWRQTSIQLREKEVSLSTHALTENIRIFMSSDAQLLKAKFWRVQKQLHLLTLYCMWPFDSSTALDYLFKHNRVNILRLLSLRVRDEARKWTIGRSSLFDFKFAIVFSLQHHIGAHLTQANLHISYGLIHFTMISHLTHYIQENSTCRLCAYAKQRIYYEAINSYLIPASPIQGDFQNLNRKP